jgi:hypothetical protein
LNVVNLLISLSFRGCELKQPRMLNLSQKLTLRHKLGVNGDGIIEDGAMNWLNDLEDRAKSPDEQVSD